MPDLEVTIPERVAEVATEAIPGYEVAAEAPVIDLPGFDDVVPELERTVDEFEKTAVEPGYPRLCPYCGFEQAEGRLCDNCGRSRVAPKFTTQEQESRTIRCPGCGSQVVWSTHCSDCGTPLPEVQG
jgi:DNA-directed RNA polymerase subunit RPC12/RpoP